MAARVLKAGSVSAVVVSLALVGAGSAAVAGPAIKVPNDAFDFGRVQQNAVVTHSFWVKSVGDQPLRILEVVPGCGCTQVPLKVSVLAPGDSTRLDITLRTKGFLGAINKRPYLVTNAGDEHTYLKLYANIVTDLESAPPISLVPAKVDVSQFTKLRRKAKFTLYNRTGRDVRLELSDGAFKSFEIKIPSEIKAGGSAEGEIKVVESAIKTEFEESFTVEALGDERMRLTIPVIRMYKPDSGSAQVGR